MGSGLNRYIGNGVLRQGKKNSIIKFIGYIFLGIVVSLIFTIYDRLSEGKPSNLMEFNFYKDGSKQIFHFNMSLLSVGIHEIGIATHDGILSGGDKKERGEYLFEYYVDGKLLEKKKIDIDTLDGKGFFKLYSTQSKYSRLPLDAIKLPLKGKYREFDLKITILKAEPRLKSYKESIYLYCGKQDKFVKKIMTKIEMKDKYLNLLSSPIDANQSDILLQPLHNALKDKDFIKIKKIIEEDYNSNVNIEMFLGRTPVHYASFYNDVKTLNYLIDRGGDIQKKDKREETPLSYAISHLAVDTTKILLDTGISKYKIGKVSEYYKCRDYPFDTDENKTFIFKIKNGWGRLYTPLYYAICTGSYDMSALMIKYNIDDSEGKNLLYIALEYIPNYKELLPLLLKYEIRPDRVEKITKKELLEIYNQCEWNKEKNWCYSLTKKWKRNDVDLTFNYEYIELRRKQEKLNRRIK